MIVTKIISSTSKGTRKNYGWVWIRVAAGMHEDVVGDDVECRFRTRVDAAK